jgi:hypothetical protein
MKHLITASTWLLLLTASANAQRAAKANKANDQEATLDFGTRSGSNLTMQGSYSMIMQMVNDGNRDSMMRVQQFKMYTDKHFMYAYPLTGDSLGGYGIGTYEVANNRLMEYPFYTAAGGARNDTVDISITKMPNGYVQVINFSLDSQGRRYALTEEYSNVGRGITSPLDGAWKQTKNTFVGNDGKTTTNTNPTQFKMYQSGHFMWASTTKDSATGKTVSYFGYGPFQMKGRREIVEIPTNSTFRTQLVGKPVTVRLDFMGNDAFRQTIQWPDGKSIEEYERLK